MKPYAFLLAIVCLGSQVRCQESGRSIPGFPSLFSNTGSTPEITFRELTNLPNNQKGFVITNSQYTPVSRTSSQLTEEQKVFIKAQDDFRKSIAEANKHRVGEEVHPREIVFQQIPREEGTSFGQDVFRTQSHPQGNFGLNLPGRTSEPFKPSQPFNEPTQFRAVAPPTFLQPQTEREEPLKPTRLPTFVQQQDVQGQTFSQLTTPSQKVETFVRPQTESGQFFQRLSPQVHALNTEPLSQTFVQSHEPLNFGQISQEPIRQSKPVFTQNQPFVETFKAEVQQSTQLRRPQRIRQKVEPTVGQVVLDDSPVEPPVTEDDLFKKQAESAKYSFQSAVADSINDNSQVRQETRDGLKLTGLYSYSDGFFKRTVHYVADENGYRVIKEDSEPIGSGPVHNPTGQVDVSTSLAGSTLQYTLKGERLQKHRNSTPANRSKH